VLFEDDDDYALLVERALEKVTDGQAEIRRGRSGLEGLALLRERVPDLVILDLKMPGMAGHEALAEIRGDETLRSVPVAVLSSSDRDDDVAKSYGLGGNHYITKPSDPVELEVKLGSLLRNLRELKGIRRGSEGATSTAESAVNPDSMLAVNLLRVGLVVGSLIALYIFGRVSGVF
jgi:DNA-binding response OmpR family regulator